MQSFDSIPQLRQGIEGPCTAAKHHNQGEPFPLNFSHIYSDGVG